jgi:hypothetical protein
MKITSQHCFQLLFTVEENNCTFVSEVHDTQDSRTDGECILHYNNMVLWHLYNHYIN